MDPAWREVFFKGTLPKGLSAQDEETKSEICWRGITCWRSLKGLDKVPAALKQLQTKVLTERLSREPGNVTEKEKSLL